MVVIHMGASTAKNMSMHIVCTKYTTSNTIELARSARMNEHMPDCFEHRTHPMCINIHDKTLCFPTWQASIAMGGGDGYVFFSTTQAQVDAAPLGLILGPNLEVCPGCDC